MNILVHAITYNCRDVIGFFVRHYATFATQIIIHDDFSDDGTREILAAHPLVSLRDWPYKSGIDEDLFQKFWQEEYPKARGEFDWLAILDPDEFLVPCGGLSMEQVLTTARKNKWDCITSVGYNLTGMEFPVDDGKSQIYEINPMGVYAPIYSKSILFNPMIDINWSRGRHFLENCHVNSSPPMVKLLHARYFGAEFTAKRNAQNLDRCVDKSVAWSCQPDYVGEHSAPWATEAHKQSFNVLEAPL